MNFMLDIDKSQYGDKIVKTAGFGETALFGAKILLIGMVTVFAVLCLIWLCLTIFKSAFSHDSKKTVKAIKTEAEPVVDVAPVVVADDSEIIAVIAAAIAAAESESVSGAKFRVVSFRRK